MTITLWITLVLMLIAFGMGLTLQLKNFLALLQQPLALTCGLVGQLILLPLVAIGLAMFIDNPLIVAGILLIAVCPGGSSSNFLTWLARGDVALSVSLTAFCSLLSIITVPLVYNGASHLVLGSGVDLSLPVAQTMNKTFMYSVFPVLVGMCIRHYLPSFARAISGWVASIAFIGLLAITPLLVKAHIGALIPIAGTVLLWVSLLLFFTMSVGFGIGKWAKLPISQCKTLTVEIGVQNVALAFYLAMVFFDDPQMVGVPAGYLLAMYVFVPGFVAFSRYCLGRDSVGGASLSMGERVQAGGKE